MPEQIKLPYFRIKVLELLLYLDALELPKDAEKPYFYKSQVEKVKAIHRLLTGGAGTPLYDCGIVRTVFCPGYGAEGVLQVDLWATHQHLYA